ncbi:Flp family type IVb pilin [Planomicrobium sp. Y74]|uniref:Flp family type IVb pilin n=1 Tax=Planomicrobium sp. Y74 TaxID=2478977 RepID=UPI002570E854|nr:Flp family type IVb pilin [Planomicrobium sp. Y74]
MMELFKGLFLEEEGQGMTEYGLILGLLAVAIIAAFAILTPQFDVLMTEIKGMLSAKPSTTTTP